MGVRIGGEEGAPVWSYRLVFSQDSQRRAVVKSEVVTLDGKEILSRPTDEDRQDPELLTQTHLQQVRANKDFREVAAFLTSVRYLHIVPQLVREPERSVGRKQDPYGGDFLEQLARTTPKTLDSRLRKIREALKIAVPNLKDLVLERDEKGVPHLKGLYEHWRPQAGWQGRR